MLQDPFFGVGGLVKTNLGASLFFLTLHLRKYSYQRGYQEPIKRGKKGFQQAIPFQDPIACLHGVEILVAPYNSCIDLLPCFWSFHGGSGRDGDLL